MFTTIALTSLLAAAPVGLQPTHRPYDAEHYKIELRQQDGATFQNTVTITLKAVKALPQIELDAYDLKVSAVKVDGEGADFKENYAVESHTGTLTIKPKKAIAAGKECTVEVAYTVTARADGSRGFFTTTEGEGEKAVPGYYTHFEPNYAERFMPVNDTPADKATSEVLAIVDTKYQVVSNGTKELDEAFTENGKNLRRVHWKQVQPHSPYLIAIAIAPFEQVLVNDDIPSHLWLPPGTKARAFVASDTLRGLFNFQVGLVGKRFPWSKLDVVAVPHFFFGGMENTSVIFERTSALLVDDRNDQLARSRIVRLLAHEMAHQYFGDDVTCAWWNDVWLNEGFASWLGTLAWDDYNDNDEAEIARARSLIEGYFPEEDGPHSHPLVVKGVPAEQAFDSTSYTKGANVLSMLDLWLGRAELKKALKEYLEKNGGKAVTSADFFKAVFEATKKEKELKPFRDAWLDKKGYPVVTPSTSYADGKLTVTIRQLPNHAGEKGAFVFKLPVVIHRETEPTYTKEELITVDKPEVKVTLDVPAAPQWINWNKDFGALAKINTVAVSEDQWVDAARQDPDPVWRLVATLQLLGELVVDKPKSDTLPTDQAMNAALDVIQKDPSPYVREAVLERLANTRFRQLPSPFAAPLLALAKRPTGLNEDPAGYIRVRNAAMGALGRVESPDGHKWLLTELARRELDINYIEGFATAAARISTANALAVLRAAIVSQKGRGAAFYRRAIEALGAGSTVDAIPLLKEILEANAQNDEVARAATVALPNNHELRETREFAALVRDVVLDEARFSEDFRLRFLGQLDDVKYENAKIALEEILAKTKSEAIKTAAAQTKSANFPTASAPAKKK